MLRTGFTAHDALLEKIESVFWRSQRLTQQKASIRMDIFKEEQPTTSKSQEIAYSALNTARGMLHRFDPKPGDGATIAYLYDRDAGTVISVEVVSNYIYVVVREDTADPTENLICPDVQTYAYAPNPEGRITTFRRKVSRPPTGRGAWKFCWRDPGNTSWHNANEPRVAFGYRRKYIYGR